MMNAFSPVKVPLKVFSILFKVHWAYCGESLSRLKGGVRIKFCLESLLSANVSNIDSMGVIPIPPPSKIIGRLLDLNVKVPHGMPT